MLALLALAGPLLSYFWQDKKTILGGVLPAALMVMVFAVVRNNILSAARGAGGFFGRTATDQFLHTFMEHVSLGAGFYVSVLAALYFLALSAKRYMVAGA